MPKKRGSAKFGIWNVKDLSIKALKVVYVCNDKCQINSYFDKDIMELAKKYGIKWYAQGMGLETGKRDLCFGETIKG